MLAAFERAYDAGFKQSGVIRANSIESLFDYSIAFAYQPLLRGNGIVVVTTAGGMRVMATDAKVERFEELLNERFDFVRPYADLQLKIE